MDNATKRNLKQQDQFVTVTSNGLEWANRNRRSAITTAVVVLAAIVAIVGGFAIYNHRAEAAKNAFGDAMAAYQTPVATPGQPAPAGTKTYESTSERAKAANGMFLDVANRYGMMRDGKIARYFAGLTYMEEGQNQSAEDTLKKVAGDWDGDVAALGKLGLAQLYRATGRDAQAVAEYNELAGGKSSTVPPGLAQIKLAEMYAAQGKNDDARKIYAQVKDKNKDDKGKPDAIGQLAAEKLDPKAAAADGPGL